MSGGASEDARSMLRLLNGLARKGATLEEAGDRLVLVVPGALRHRGAGSVEREFARGLVEAAMRQGWVTAEGGRFRLAEAGALALHAGLSGLAPPSAPAMSAAKPIRVPLSARPLPQRRAPRPASATPSHQMEAAERLAEDFQCGQMTPRITSNWDRAALGAVSAGTRDGSGRGVDVSERISAAQERVRRALADAGPEFADVLIGLCCLETGIEAFESERGWPRRSAKLVLGLALDRLARHYGIVARGPTSGRISHWGDGSHRPA